MPTIEANGLTIGYEVAGAGPPLVMLHGATGSGRDHFAHQIPVVSPAFRTYLPDARGHGATRWDPAAGLATADMVDDLEAFVDRLNLATFHLLGYSMGAMTALHFAARHPHRLRTLVAVSITPEREPRLSVGRSLMDPARIDRQDPGWGRQLSARHDPVQGPGAWRRLLPAIVEDVATQPLLSGAALRRIDAPALVAVGDRDPFVPVEHARSLARQVRDGQLLVVPGVGHDVLVDGQEVLHAGLAWFYRATESTARTRAGDPPVATEVAS